MRRTNHYITHRYTGATVAVHPTLPLFYINTARFSLQFLFGIQHYLSSKNEKSLIAKSIASCIRVFLSILEEYHGHLRPVC